MKKHEFKVGDLVRYDKSVGKGFPGIGIIIELRSLSGCIVFSPEGQYNSYAWFCFLEPINEKA